MLRHPLEVGEDALAQPAKLGPHHRRAHELGQQTLRTVVRGVHDPRFFVAALRPQSTFSQSLLAPSLRAVLALPACRALQAFARTGRLDILVSHDLQ